MLRFDVRACRWLQDGPSPANGGRQLVLDFDIVIVGGGAAGCAVARRLADAGEHSVLLLEAGTDLGGQVPPALRDGWNNPSGSDWTHDWGFESEPDGAGATSKLRRGRLLGGTSWLTRFGVRGVAADFDAWAARGNPGWRYEDVLPSFRRLETDAEFGDRPWHGDRGPLNINRYPELERSPIHAAALEALSALGFPSVEDHNAPDAVGAGPMPMSTKEGRRITSLDAYLPPDARPANLKIRTGSPVATVVIGGRRATGVRLVDGTEVGARWVVLSAGTYGSPSLLLRSGVGPAGHLRELGIDVLVDLPGVGENLADHPGTELDTGWRGDPPAGAPVLHTIATFRSSTQPRDRPPDLMFWVTDPTPGQPAFYLDPILLKPTSRGSVRLRSSDPEDKPRVTLPGLRESHDVERLAEAYLLGLELAIYPAVRTLANEPAPAPPGSHKELRAQVIAGSYSNPHVVGTCRMGPSPANGDVVDALGRVHGIEQLSVIDASVIPDAPSGFPHVITLMVAEHLSEKLARLL
ncbi:MAG: FAD-dependent oxidoreductase [Chloroflexi bacterium]|nr:FAD-dependent oxidoreductase [Chloroflexota bacterium]